MCEQLTANKHKIQINTISFFFSVVKRMVLTVALAARMLNCRKGSFYLISPLFFFSLTSDQFSAARSSDRRFKIVQKQKIGNCSEAENVWTRSRRQYLHRISLMAKITTEYLFPRVTILPINNSRSALNCFLFASVTTLSRPWSANKTFLGLPFFYISPRHRTNNYRSSGKSRDSLAHLSDSLPRTIHPIHSHWVRQNI